MSSSDTANEPLSVRSGPMMKTKTTEHWPQSWTRPLDVPSGVGNVTFGRVLHADRQGADDEEAERGGAR